MAGWLGVFGVVIGATVALFGQFMSRAIEYRRESSRLFIEYCATLISLEEDFRNRVWEERNLALRDSVSKWDLVAYRMVEAQIRLTARDALLLRSLADLREAGQQLGKVWRLNSRESDELAEAWKRHKSALDSFIGIAKRSVK
jgi:hypothetical protein